MSCPPQTTVHAGQQLSIIVTWDNTGTQAHAFDVWAEIGDYDAGTGKFTAIGNNIVKDVSSGAGQTGIQTEVPIGVVPSSLVRAKPYYVMATITDYNEASPPDSIIYNGVICQDALIIST